MIRPCTRDDFEAVYAIVNDAASAYKGVIPADCWHEPYMPRAELRAAIDGGIAFWGYETDGALIGVMGIQPVQDVTLIRHAYVRTARRRGGIGSQLLRFLLARSATPALVGTWAAADWAIRFYEKHGFRLVTPAEKDRLLPKYWGVPPRQIETSVVLGDQRWFDAALTARIRTPSQESIEYLRELRKRPAFGAVGNDFNLDGLRQGMGARQAPADPRVQCIPSRVDGIPCEWVVAPGADPDLRLLYLHGGGFVSGSGGNYIPLAASISAAAQCAVLLPDYRLAPEHPFPAGLEDCVRAHNWMTVAGPNGPSPARATFIAGDSAGGGLTLSTLLALRDRRRPLPVAGMPLSASTDLTLVSESMRTEEDPICSARAMPVFADLYLAGASARHPLASPVFGDYTGIPPLLIQVGEHEMLRDDCVRVAAKARADGVDVTLEVWPGQVHVFQIRGLPESREAIVHIADFMRRCLARR